MRKMYALVMNYEQASEVAAAMFYIASNRNYAGGPSHLQELLKKFHVLASELNDDSESNRGVWGEGEQGETS